MQKIKKETLIKEISSNLDITYFMFKHKLALC